MTTASGYLQEQPVAAATVTSGVEHANSDINEPSDPAAPVAAVNGKSGKQQRRGAAVLHQPKRLKKG